MASYPNQYEIEIRKSNNKSRFIMIDYEDFFEAYKRLTKSELGFYMYLVGNQQGYKLMISRKVVCEVLDISETTYERLIPSLKKKGYLVEGNAPHKLIFYSKPIVEEKKEEVKAVSTPARRLTDAEMKAAYDNYFNGKGM